MTVVTAALQNSSHSYAMGNGAPFVHAWILPVDIEPGAWSALHADLVAVLRAASAELEQHRPDANLAVLRGPNGFGPLIIQHDAIAFNGNAFLGDAGDPFSVERVSQSGIISRRSTDGSRRAVHRCDTRGRPYDLAVCSVLIALVVRLGDNVRVGTSGTLRTGWGRAASVVRTATGEAGQLVQKENGVIHWVRDVASDSRPTRTSA